MKILSLAKTFPPVTAITVFALLAGLGCSRNDSMGGVGDGAAPDTTTSQGGAGGGGASGSEGGASAGSGSGEDASAPDTHPTGDAGCDPFAPGPKPIVLGEILGVGKTADGTIYVVDESNSVHRVFVSNSGILVRQRGGGGASTVNPDGSKTYSFAVDWVAAADAGKTTFSLAIEIDSQGKVRMGVVQGVLEGKGFVIGQQGEELTVLQTSAIAGMALRNLPGEVRLEYAAKMEMGPEGVEWLVVTRPVDDWTYSDFRLFMGKPASGLVERKVTNVQRFKDGGSTTITFDNAGVQAVAKFPVVFADGGFVAGPATLESGASQLSLELQSSLPADLNYRCLPVP